MRPLPNGGVELTPAEAFAVKQIVQAAGEDAYNLLGVQDAMSAGLDLAGQFSAVDDLSELLTSIAMPAGASMPRGLAADRTTLAIVGTALQALAA